MKILILGHGGHGKDTVAEMIHKLYGLTFESSSLAAAEIAVYPHFKGKYSTVQECYDDRRNWRQVWKWLIAQYNTPDKARLTREILKRCDMYVGMRCPLEYQAGKHLYDLQLWVDASKRKPVESSMGIEFDPSCMVKIDNNGTLVDLLGRVAHGSELFKFFRRNGVI